MIVSLSQVSRPHFLPVPERRRAVIIGAGAAGLTAAMHIGEHALLLEQRSAVGSIGSDIRRGVGELRARELHEWTGTPVGGYSTTAERVRITRWEPPALAPESPQTVTPSRQSLGGLVPLLRGELRLETRVARLMPALRRVELANGGAIIYDKLVSTVKLLDLVELLGEYVPSRVRSSHSLMNWLNARDVELADEESRELLGEASPFVAGRRAAERVTEALERRFRAPRTPQDSWRFHSPSPAEC